MQNQKSLEIKLCCLFRKEIAENSPDHHDHSKVDEIRLGRGEERGENIGGDEKFKPKNDLVGKIPADLVVGIRGLRKLPQHDPDYRTQSPEDDQDGSRKPENDRTVVDEIENRWYVHTVFRTVVRYELWGYAVRLTRDGPSMN